MFRGGTVFATSFVLFSSLRQHGLVSMGQQLELFEGDNYVIEDESIGGDEVDNLGV